LRWVIAGIVIGGVIIWGIVITVVIQVVIGALDDDWVINGLTVIATTQSIL